MSSTSRRTKILLNPYRDWAKAQRIPIYEGFGLDLLALETSRWDFTETNGALEDEKIRFDWKHGWVFAPGDQMFHLHFTKGAEPCRYYASALGSRRYPFNERKEAMYRGEQPKNMKIDGAQLEYTEQPPGIPDRDGQTWHFLAHGKVPR
jgi:hypothetical protein